MTWLILGFGALLSLAAGESPYGDRYSVGSFFFSFDSCHSVSCICWVFNVLVRV